MHRAFPILLAILTLSACATAPDVPGSEPAFVSVGARRIAYAEYGDPAGAPLIFMHGGPGSRLEGSLFDDAARASGVRLIAPDRPGLGASDMAEAVSLEQTARDMTQLADALGLECPVLMGWSGGGVPAVATGGLTPARFASVFSLAGYTRLDSEELRALVPEPDQTAMGIMDERPRRFRFFFKLTRFAVRRTPGAFWRALLRDAGEADLEVYEREGMRGFFIADQQEALNQGVDGIVADARLSYSPDWGFDPTTSSLRLHVYQGTDDTRVPKAFAEDLARLFPGAELHMLEGEGHMFPITRAGELMRAARASWETDREVCAAVKLGTGG